MDTEQYRSSKSCLEVTSPTSLTATWSTQSPAATARLAGGQRMEALVGEFAARVASEGTKALSR